MGLLELDGWGHAECGVKPSVVTSRPSRRGGLDVGDGLERTLVEDGGADAFGLVQAIDRLHQRIVVGVADRPDRWSDPFECEVLGEPDRGVLRSGMVDQLAVG